MARAIDAEELLVYLHCRMGQFPCDEYGLYLLADVAEYVAKMPTIESKQEWISAKVRPPKVGEEVLVYWDDGFEIGSYTGGEVGEGVYWMPLPDPPKEGE